LSREEKEVGMLHIMEEEAAYLARLCADESTLFSQLIRDRIHTRIMALTKRFRLCSLMCFRKYLKKVRISSSNYHSIVNVPSSY